MKISFDLDGVLVDFASAAIEEIRKTYRSDLPADYKQVTWCFQDVITMAQWESIFYKLLQRDNMWTYLPAYRNNVEALQHYILAHGDEDVYFITARPPCEGGSVVTMTQLWLLDHGLPFKNLIVVKHPSDKKQVIAETGIQFHLDDLPATIQECLSLPNHHPFLLSWPYNEGVDLPRVHSVDEYLLEVSVAE